MTPRRMATTMISLALSLTCAVHSTSSTCGTTVANKLGPITEYLQKLTTRGRENVESACGGSGYERLPIAASDSSFKSRFRRSTSMTLERLQSQTHDLQSRSACPWTYGYNTDPARQPSTLIQAQCSYRTIPGTSFHCEHVYWFIQVKITMSGAVHDRWYKIKVGCTLASLPIVIRPPSTNN